MKPETNRTYVVIAYDIPDDRRRARLARFLEGYGERVQKSVFECDLQPTEYERLVAELARRWCEGDALRVYRLSPHVAQQTRIFGGRGLVELKWLTIVSGSGVDVHRLAS